MSDTTPAWVLRMENCPIEYRCSGFESREIAREWRENQSEIERLQSAYASQHEQDEATIAEQEKEIEELRVKTAWWHQTADQRTVGIIDLQKQIERLLEGSDR